MSDFFDTHAHLNNTNQYPDYFCLNVTTVPSEWQAAIDLYKHHNNLLPAIGIHPWFVEQVQVSDIDLLQQLVVQDHVFAMGEIGLDFTDNHRQSRELQLDIFEQQLVFAKQYQLPVSVHCLKAHKEVLNLLKKTDLGKLGVMHGLGASKEIVQQYLDIGFKIGVNSVLCRDNARRYHEMIQSFDLQHFVLETDYPNMLIPGLDKPEFDDIKLVAAKIAELKSMTIESVLEQTEESARQVFLR